MIPELTPAQYIKSDAELRDLVKRLSQQKEIAVDTESNNMYAYRGQVCLIQLSSREADYIIDPLAIEDMQPLGELLANPDVEKIFHAAEYDLICLERDFGFEVHNLFDTMFAARLCQITQFGLADLLLQYFGVEVDKRHQLDDWGKRPLPEDSLIYAQMDTHYLHDLRDLLHDQLVTDGKIEETREVFADVLRIDAKSPEFDPDGFWKLGRPRRLNRRQMAILRELYILRDELARDEDQPPYKVMPNGALVTLSRQPPHNFSDLFRTKGLSARLARVYGDDIMAAIERGKNSRPPRPPESDAPDHDVSERYTALHAWRKERALERGLDSSLVLSKQTLWDIAHQMPADKASLGKIDGIGEWRLQFYGDELLALIDSLR